MRDAESTLDQLISFCGNEIAESDVLSMFGLTAQSQIHSLTQAILDGKIEPALRELNDLAKQGKDLSRLVSELLNHFRNLLIYQVSKGDMRILEVSESEAAALKEQSAALSSDALTRIMEVFTDCEGRLRDAASKKILIEVALLKAIEARNAVSIDTVLKQLQQMRSGSGSGMGVPPARSVEKPTASAAPMASAPAAQSAATVAQVAVPVSNSEIDLENLWSQLVESVGRASPFVKTYFLEAHPVSFVKNVFTIGFDPEFADHIALVDNSRNHAIVQTKLAELGFPNCSIKFIKADAPPNRVRPVGEAEPVVVPSAAMRKEAAAAPQKVVTETAPAKPKLESIPFSKEDFKNDPLIQKALEIFKGQIVDVRS
jgi:DNA polymerase-3 subunit gamma/tau